MDKTKIAPGPFTVGIVGGGIGGLMLAVGLLRRRIAVEIFEAASAFGEVGLGLNIGPAAIRAIPLIDSDICKVLDTLITTHGDSPGFEDFRQTWFEVVMTAGKDAGRTVMRLEAEPSGATTIRRSDLLDTLVNAIPRNLAHFGKRLKYFTETEKGVHLHFEDGSSRLVDALVGADGIRSKVKECLLPEEVETTRPRYSGMYCYRAVLDMEDMVEAVGNHRAHVASWYLGKSTYAISYPIMRGKKVNVGLYKQQESWDFDTWIRPATKEEMIQDFEHMGDSIRGIMEVGDYCSVFD
ncbi:hypothetical protein K4F52_005627 [Lecanicillium sp. MT-2017a]|nr:hypothetical protein K4F52_005627 [Lecanicillium sp. MT-2017a]